MSFQSEDVLSLDFESSFDVVTTARMLQWVSAPEWAIVQMKRATKPGGRLVALDYNHALHAWFPEPPPRFVQFYSAFLDWRTANG